MCEFEISIGAVMKTNRTFLLLSLKKSLKVDFDFIEKSSDRRTCDYLLRGRMVQWLSLDSTRWVFRCRVFADRNCLFFVSINFFTE